MDIHITTASFSGRMFPVLTIYTKVEILCVLTEKKSLKRYQKKS
jgi:hypothetical protein